jgi:mannose-6-phosphate isomerase-like protein (cupin superfamily)
MQTLYAYSGRDVAELRRGLAVMVHDEFTDGELDVAPRREVRSVHRTGLSGPVTFMHSLNGTDISFRRSWHHIRARTAAVRLLYFVLQGEIQVVSAAGSYTVPSGRCAVINADEPFYTRCSVPEGGSFESALAVVPEHLILSRMPWAKNLTTCFEVDAGHRPVVTSLLELLCFEGDRLSRRAADPLTEATRSRVRCDPAAWWTSGLRISGSASKSTSHVPISRASGSRSTAVFRRAISAMC